MEDKRYILNKIEQFNDANILELFQTPTLVYGGGFVLCLKGSCTILINAKSYFVERWDLIVISPYSVVQVEGPSADFNYAIIGVDLNFLSLIDLPDKGSYFINARSHPSIKLNAPEANDILNLRKILLREEQNKNQPFYTEIHTLILKIITFKVLATYSNREPNHELAQSRSNEISNTFIFDLLKHNHEERKLEYYAQRQSITPSYLSRCVKKAIGKNASDLLIESVINNIKFRLQDTTIPIAEISEEFHFSSSSTFSQYFKKYTSISPRDYRNKRSRMQIKTLTQ